MADQTEIPEAAAYVSRCIVCGKPGNQHSDGRWCGSEQRVNGDWTDVPIVADVARAIGAAFHRGDDAWTTEALAAIAAARPHLTAEWGTEVARLRAENEQLHHDTGLGWEARHAAEVDLDQVIEALGLDPESVQLEDVVARVETLRDGVKQIAWGLALAANDFNKEFGTGPSDTRDVLNRVLDLARTLADPPLPAVLAEPPTTTTEEG